MVPVHQREADVAGVVIIRRSLSRTGMGNLPPGVGIEERVIGWHCCQWLIPRGGVIQAGLPRMHQRSQAGIDGTTASDVGVLISQTGIDALSKPQSMIPEPRHDRGSGYRVHRRLDDARGIDRRVALDRR
jgi:hypothetical protein